MDSFHQFFIVNNELLEFEFTEILNPQCPRYFVKVFKDREPVTSFEMKYHYSRWDIVPSAPEWAAAVRLQLSGVVEKFRNEFG